jgi:hypothetical protein
MIRRALGVTVLGAGFVALIAACSSDSTPAPKYPTADSFCSAKADEECKAVAASCVVSVDTCKNARVQACTSNASSATGQGLTYRPENAEDCIAKTTAVYADRTIDPAKEKAFDESCGRVFSGNKQRNDACANLYECGSGLTCDLDKKVCAVKTDRAEKDPCNNPGDICGTNLYCAGTVNKVCTPKAKLGETCRDGDQGIPCTDDVRCNGTSCVALENAAEPCDTNDDCSTHFCNSEKKCAAKQYASENGTCKDFGGAS